MKQIEATIMGQSYLLGCPEGGEQDLMTAVSAVDREMCGIRDAGRVKARDRIAVLAALNLAYALEQNPATRRPDPVPAPAVAVTPPRDEAAELVIATLVGKLDNALREDGRLL